MLITFLPIVYIQKQIDAIHTPEHQKAALVASFQPGDSSADATNRYEHGDGTEAAQDANRQGLRSATWFSYDVPIDPAHPVAIQATYRNSEPKEEHFKIRAGTEKVKDADGNEQIGEEIGDETVDMAPKKIDADNPVNFYTVEYVVPNNLVEGKKSISIRFQADKDIKDNTKPSAVAAVYQIASIQDDKPSYWWQVLAYALITAAEVMVSIPILEFAYTHAPKKMKSLVMAFYFACSISAGNFILNQLSGVLKHHFSASFFMADPSKPKFSPIPISNFYWFYIVYLLVMTFVFVGVSRLIHLKPMLGGDIDVKAETETPRGEPLAPSSEH
jgi:POT family